MHGGEVVICDGSLPPGVPNDGYAQLVADARDAGCSILVDAAPGPLGAALQAHPDVVSPNLSEAEALLRGRSDEQVDERGPDIEQRALVAAEELRGRGARYAVVTAGAAGAALATPTGAWWLTAPKINVVSSIGAGDSFVAGVAGSLSAGLLDVETVRRGIAVASASCEQQLAGGVDYRRVEELMRGVVVRQVRQAECTEVRS
jgi:fructose-1-phosphate kinase PfkB-like protein